MDFTPEEFAVVLLGPQDADSKLRPMVSSRMDVQSNGVSKGKREFNDLTSFLSLSEQFTTVMHLDTQTRERFFVSLVSFFQEL